MDNTAADKAGHVHATATVVGAFAVFQTRFHSFGLSSMIALCCYTPILLTLVSAPAHSPCSADHAVRSAMARDKAPATSALELRSPWPHLRRERASFCYICAGTGTGRCHICTGTGRIPATSAQRLGVSLPHLLRDLAQPLPDLRRDWAHPCQICRRAGLIPATSTPGPGSPIPHLRRDWARPCPHLRHGCSAVLH